MILCGKFSQYMYNKTDFVHKMEVRMIFVSSSMNLVVFFSIL